MSSRKTEIFIDGVKLTSKSIAVLLPKSQWVEQLELAISEERYEDCTRIKKVIDNFNN